MASLEESLESLLLTPFGMALMMLGGWSLSLWKDFKTVPGFMYIVQSIGLCEDFQGHIQVLHRLLVGLRSGDLQPVGGRDPADHLFGDLVLQLGEPTGGQEVVLVQAHIEALALEWAEEEKSYNVAAIGSVK